MNYLNAVDPTKYHTRAVSVVLMSENTTVLGKLTSRTEDFIINKMQVVAIDCEGKNALTEPHDNLRVQIKDENTNRYRYDEAIPLEAFDVGGVDNNFPGRFIAGNTEQTFTFSSAQLIDETGSPISAISKYPIQITIVINGYLN